jgi:pilus assembly protein CpaE
MGPRKNRRHKTAQSVYWQRTMAQPAHSEARQQKIRILIVDDVPETRENLRKLLFFESDMEVIGAATSGEEGISLAAEMKPDIVLMDINMPGIDGVSATQTITQQTPTCQVIMMSVQGETDYLRRSMQAGAREFLIKPFTSEDLINSIRRVHELSTSRRQMMPIASALESVSATDAGRPAKNRGKIITVFSPKGGTGCSTLAVNLAIAIRQAREELNVALVDTCLQFGDVAVLLNLQSPHSIVDLPPHFDEVDADLLENVMVSHHSGVRVLLAPTRPEMADRVVANMLETVLQMLQKTYDYVIVDTSSSLSDITLTTLDAADRIILITAPDIPAIKDAKLFFEVTDALEYPPSKTILVLNKADPHNSIRAEDIQNSIKHPVAVQIPLDERTAMLAANQGIPYIVSARTNKLGQATAALARLVVESLAEKSDERQPEVKILSSRIVR